MPVSAFCFVSRHTLFAYYHLEGQLPASLYGNGVGGVDSEPGSLSTVS